MSGYVPFDTSYYSFESEPGFPFCCNTVAVKDIPRADGDDTEKQLHPRIIELLSSANSNKANELDPFEGFVDSDASIILSKADWYIRLEHTKGNHSFSETYLAPSESKPGFLIGIYKGEKGLRNLVPEALQFRVTSFPQEAVIECEKHGQSWSCWVYERVKIQEDAKFKEETKIKEDTKLKEGVEESRVTSDKEEDVEGRSGVSGSVFDIVFDFDALD